MVDVFVHTRNSWNIETTISEWYQKPFKETAEFWQNPCDYEVVALPTFPEHHMDVLQNLTNLNCPKKQRIVAVVHNPGVLLDKKRRTFSNSHYNHESQEYSALSQSFAWRTGYPMLMTYVARLAPHLLALAPHTVEATLSAVRRQGLTLPVSLVCSDFFQSERTQALAHCLQLNVRDLYCKVFLSLTGSVFISLVGGEVAIPPALSGVVVKEENLPYKVPPIPLLLHECLITTPGYKRPLLLCQRLQQTLITRTKASSSVAAAIICCTPLIANKNLMTAYNYLDEVGLLLHDMVYFKEGNETDAEAMARIQALPEADLNSRGEALERLRQRLFAHNQAALDWSLRVPPVWTDRITPPLMPGPPSSITSVSQLQL
eukprot:jgi/Botrbrau1/12560/Bobra.0169s0095.1